MIKHLAISLVVLLILGCASSADDPQFEIAHQSLTSLSDSQFEFLASVDPHVRDSINLRKIRSRSELKAMINEVQFSQSKAQKIAFEDFAIEALEAALAEQGMCSSGYAIDGVKWLEHGVIFNGECQP